MFPVLILEQPRSELRRRLEGAERFLQVRRFARARRSPRMRTSQLSHVERQRMEERNIHLVLLANWRIM